MSIKSAKNSLMYSGFLKKLKGSYINRIFGKTTLYKFLINFEEKLFGYSNDNKTGTLFEFSEIISFKDSLEKNKLSLTDWKFGFEVVCKKKKLILFAKDKADYEDWVSCFNRVLKYRQEKDNSIPKKIFDLALDLFYYPYIEEIEERKAMRENILTKRKANNKAKNTILEKVENLKGNNNAFTILYDKNMESLLSEADWSVNKVDSEEKTYSAKLEKSSKVKKTLLTQPQLAVGNNSNNSSNSSRHIISHRDKFLKNLQKMQFSPGAKLYPLEQDIFPENRNVYKSVLYNQAANTDSRIKQPDDNESRYAQIKSSDDIYNGCSQVVMSEGHDREVYLEEIPKLSEINQPQKNQPPVNKDKIAPLKSNKKIIINFNNDDLLDWNIYDENNQIIDGSKLNSIKDIFYKDSDTKAKNFQIESENKYQIKPDPIIREFILEELHMKKGSSEKKEDSKYFKVLLEGEVGNDFKSLFLKTKKFLFQNDKLELNEVQAESFWINPKKNKRFLLERENISNITLGTGKFSPTSLNMNTNFNMTGPQMIKKSIDDLIDIKNSYPKFQERKNNLSTAKLNKMENYYDEINNSLLIKLDNDETNDKSLLTLTNSKKVLGKSFENFELENLIFSKKSISRNIKIKNIK